MPNSSLTHSSYILHNYTFSVIGEARSVSYLCAPQREDTKIMFSMFFYKHIRAERLQAFETGRCRRIKLSAHVWWL